MGDLLVWVKVKNVDEEQKVTDILWENGGQQVAVPTLTRYAMFDERPIDYNDPFDT